MTIKVRRVLGQIALDDYKKWGLFQMMIPSFSEVTNSTRLDVKFWSKATSRLEAWNTQQIKVEFKGKSLQSSSVKRADVLWITCNSSVVFPGQIESRLNWSVLQPCFGKALKHQKVHYLVLWKQDFWQDVFILLILLFVLLGGPPVLKVNALYGGQRPLLVPEQPPFPHTTLSPAPSSLIGHLSALSGRGAAGRISHWLSAV